MASLSMNPDSPVEAASSTARRAGGLAIVAAIGFVAIVSVLHVLQPGYDLNSQLMSELALGAHGWAMVVAFFLLATSTVSLAFGIWPMQRAPWVQLSLVVAAVGFLGAGVFPLGRASELHIWLIAIAFVAIVLAMYLLPRAVPARFGGRAGLFSWCLAGGTALSIVLGHSLVPMGVGQRLAAACVVVWLCFAGLRLRGS